MVNGTPAQQFIPIKEIRDGVVVLKDGGLRSILMASSVNLALKSEDEQKATVMEFQNFLNALEFSIQVSVQSRHVDIRPYINTLQDRLHEQKEDLLRTQTQEYIGFIQWFTENTNIMTKNFYVIVPYNHAPLSQRNSGFTLKKYLPFLGGGSSESSGDEEHTKFEQKRNQLEQRVGVVQQGLSGMGVRSTELGTQEAMEVYYQIFNPGDTERSAPEPGQE